MAQKRFSLRHWSALASLGVRLRAWPAGKLDEFTPYREPLPLQRREFPLPGPGNRGINRVEVFDPEDPDGPQEEPEPVKPRRALAR